MLYVTTGTGWNEFYDFTVLFTLCPMVSLGTPMMP